MAQPFRAPRRQSDSVLAVDLVTPTRGQSVSQSSYQKRSRASEQPVAARPTKKKRDDGLWPTAEESYFIELLKQDNDARNAGQTMLQGEARITRMAVKINERFHNQEPTKYRKKEWKQIRSKETNLRALCKEILGKVYGATKAKTVRSLPKAYRDTDPRVMVMIVVHLCTGILAPLYTHGEYLLRR